MLPTTFITVEVLKSLPKADFIKPTEGGTIKRKTAILMDTREKLLVEEKNLNLKAPGNRIMKPKEKSNPKNSCRN